MRLLIASSLLMLTSPMVNAEVTALLEQEWAGDKHGHANKLESRLIPELNYQLSDGWQMTMIGEIRYDSFANLNSFKNRPDSYSSINGPILTNSTGSFAIKEWYFDSEIGDSFWRIGKQQVVWGQADGLKILDVVNPQSFSEFILQDFEDSRIPLWMLNIDATIDDDSSIQFLWIPDTTYNEFAEEGSIYNASSELLRPDLAEATLLGFNKDKPTSAFSDGDFGIRVSSFLNGWDLTLNWLYHYHDSPVISQQETQQGVLLESRYFRNHLIGASASNAFGDFTIRAEVGYNNETYHYTRQANLTTEFTTTDFATTNLAITESDQNSSGVHQSDEFASVIGLDWQGIENAMLSVQWFQSHLFDYPHDSKIIRKQQINTFSFLYRHSFINETLEFELLALHGLEYADNSFQLKLSYQLESNVDLWVGVDVFSGNSNGLFGQFDQTDRLTLGWRWGFD